jgi:hypothetical protein
MTRPPQPQWIALREWVDTVTEIVDDMITESTFTIERKLALRKSLAASTEKLQDQIDSKWCQVP